MAEIKKFYAWIGPSNGCATIYWHADTPERYDWVGLYKDEQKEQNDYLKYQWVSKGSPYATSIIITDNLNVRYFTWDKISGKYVELMRTRGLHLEDEVNVPGESELQPGCWVTSSKGSSCTNGGYAELNWTAAKSQRERDWVALYKDVNKSNDDYIAWHWAVGNSSYVTSVAFEPGIHARYIKEGSPSIALRRSKPIAKGFFDLENIYSSMEGDLNKIFKIMEDQLKKAVNGDPSVFSPGIWPFAENLPYKNISYEEVKVIGRRLKSSQYYDVIRVYWETYNTALKTADDGERIAKRHAFWQIAMTQGFGEEFAKEMGSAHEKGRLGTKEDRRVNDLNNAAAIEYAKNHPDVDPFVAANDMWSSGLLADYNEKVKPGHTRDEL